MSNECEDRMESPSSLACIHLMVTSGQAYYPLPRPEGEEGAPHMVCEDCAEAGGDVNPEFIYEICLVRAQDIQARHFCGECLFYEGPCEYHGASGVESTIGTE